MFETRSSELATYFFGHSSQYLHVHLNNWRNILFRVTRHDHLDQQVYLIGVMCKLLFVDLGHHLTNGGAQIRHIDVLTFRLCP
jgi:hypothetical protein